MQLEKLFEETRREAESLAWEGSFRDYIAMSIENPKLARLSHVRIYDMLQWAGVGAVGADSKNYPLFDELFGSQRTIQRLHQIFHAASQIPEERRRILLLMGPPGSGKSSLVNFIKRGLEQYSRTDEGALYAIVGCPMQEEPLHLVPQHRRAELKESYGLDIEGDLCPRCRDNLKHVYKGDIAQVKVKRLVFGESEGIGIGSFVATSPQGQNLDRLIGSIDVDGLAEDRLDGASKALRMDGELEAANRGIMEFIQIFRSDDKFLTVVLGVTQEQIIKLGTYGSVYADETIIAHSNEAEYNNFVSNKESEALLDRLIMLRVPYTLQRSEEVKIYRKLLSDGHYSSVHMSPLSLPLVASMAILSRLDNDMQSQRKDSMKKRMEMYDGRAFPNFAIGREDSLQDDNSNEGMFGISPRFVINRLADAIYKESTCLRPLEALETLMEGFEERAGITKEDLDRLPVMLPEAISSYNDLAIRQIQRASTERFEELALGQFLSYVEGVKDFFTEESRDARSRARMNDQLLRRLEGAINVPDSRRESFRREVLDTYERLISSGLRPTYSDFPLLNAALEQMLLPNTRDISVMLRDNRKQLHHRESISKRLIANYGYCDECAQDLILHTAEIIRNRDVVTVKNGKLLRK